MMQQPTAPLQYSSQVLQTSDLLAALSSAGQTKKLEDLADLLVVPLKADPEYISPKASRIRALERCFHLARGVRETPNWWLYDELGAAIIDTLAQRIRACQSALFASALTHPTTPAG